MLAKRTLDDALQPTKRTRLVDYGRLCDLREGLTTFACPLNAMRAKERGFLRNREASSKYEEVDTADPHDHPPDTWRLASNPRDIVPRPRPPPAPAPHTQPPLSVRETVGRNCSASGSCSSC